MSHDKAYHPTKITAGRCHVARCGRSGYRQLEHMDAVYSIPQLGQPAEEEMPGPIGSKGWIFMSGSLQECGWAESAHSFKPTLV